MIYLTNGQRRQKLRKLPSHYHRSQDEAVFVYRHECFSRGHPERLSGVVRNTAVRRTQREKSIRDLEAKHGKILFDDNDSHDKSPVKTKICCLKKEVDESHPLLKSNQASNGLPTGTLAGTQKRAKSSKVTTVYFNSRGPTSDIQTMSPSKLHHQVADILSALNQSDDEDGPPFKRSCTIRTVHRPADLEKKGATLACLDKLSQDSNLPTSCNHLMFGCPLDENDDLDDNDLSLDFDPSLYGTNHDYMSILNSLNTDFGSKCLDDGLCHTVMCSRDIDVLNGQMMSNNAIDSVTSFLDDQILTPAYFDPETGLVTLLLPEF
ncbi:hypothetical protein DPMN_175888 [Dreissena polymorpha]|uniref:Uncharacterized protein n=2 Tax=Dreissena polymorpha TaxID=45954 RepID=A0A9D4E941_DREPO|nr:hypothetical protein DPMN_175888 [Dreissena polymorpha]